MAGKKKDIAGDATKWEDVPEIPKDEQPWPLPEGWKWIRGNAIFAGEENTIPTGNSFEYIDIESVDNSNNIVKSPKKIAVKDAPSRAKRKVHTGDTLFSMVRPYLKNIAYIDDSLSKCIASTGFYVCTPTAIINGRYLFWLMTSDYVVNGLNVYMRGDNSPSIKKENIENFLFPVPQLEIQQRIVNRIESLFSKLDEAAAKVQAVIDSHEAKKQAILHKTFSGELTMMWREKNGVSFDSWQLESIDSLCHSLIYGTAKKSKDVGSIIVIRMGNLQDGEIAWNNLAYSDDIDDIQKYILSPNDVLFNRTNSPELVGKTSIYRGEYPAIYAGYLIKLDYKKELLHGQYLNYVMNYRKTKEYCNSIKSDGGNQSNINAKKLGSYIIPVPSLHEQNEIINILNNFTLKAKQLVEAAKTLLKQIKLIKTSILMMAVRGELKI